MKSAIKGIAVLVLVLAAFAAALSGCVSAPINKSNTQWSTLPKELSIEVVKAPEVTMSEEATSKFITVIGEEFAKNGWMVKEVVSPAPPEYKFL